MDFLRVQYFLLGQTPQLLYTYTFIYLFGILFFIGCASLAFLTGVKESAITHPDFKDVFTRFFSMF